MPPKAAAIGAGLEGVRRVRAAERHLHVRMDVDPAGDDVLTRRVEHAVARGLHALEVPGVRSGGDLVAVDQDVVVLGPGRREDRPPVMSTRAMALPVRQWPYDVGTTVAIEGPLLADLLSRSMSRSRTTSRHRTCSPRRPRTDRAG